MHMFVGANCVPKMNDTDIADLSYKELQALAVKYRVPGNIKKYLLVQILQAVKGRNDTEVSRLLTELKQTRKKKVKQTKFAKINPMTPVQMQNLDYTMAAEGRYYLRQQQQQQQQQPQQQLQPQYHWVDAAETTIRGEEENRDFLNCNELRQFLLHRLQREYENCDINSNDIGETPIVMDLRTDLCAPVCPGIFDNTTANDSSYEYRVLENIGGQSNKSMLKKMLQAPVGANLGEIASPVSGTYFAWSQETTPEPDELLDDSDTMTAESESNATDQLWQNDPNYSHIIDRVPDSKILYDFDETHKVAFETNSSCNRYESNYVSSNAQENCRMWINSNSEPIQGINYLDDGKENSRLFSHLSFQGGETLVIDERHSPNNDKQLNYQYPNNELSGFELNQCLFSVANDNFSQAQANCTDRYYSGKTFNKQPQVPQDDFTRPTYSTSEVNFIEEVYIPIVQNTPSQLETSADPTRYLEYPESPVVALFHNTDVENVSCSTVQNTSQVNAMVEMDPIQIHPQQENLNVGDQISTINNEQISEAQHLKTNDALDLYWPRWSMGNNLQKKGLENLLNYSTNNNVDYTKLDQTCCVDIYNSPLVTQQLGTSSAHSTKDATIKQTVFLENRKHNFMSYWLLYDGAHSSNSREEIVDVSSLQSSVTQE